MMGLGLWLVLVSAPAALQISPPDDANLTALLNRLARTHAPPAWCEGGCATLTEVQITGSLTRGELTVVFEGAVSGEGPAFVELMGSPMDLGLEELLGAGGGKASVFWSGQAYSVVLLPGPFTLRGTCKLQPGAALTLSVPGPAGWVRLDVPDAEVVGGERRRGLQGATVHLTPRSSAAPERPAQRLRLDLQRRFVLGRDRTFTVEVRASGATVGQVITLPVLPGESIEDLQAHQAHVEGEGRARRIAWVADGAEPTLRYSGKWTEARIALQAPGGAVKEAWQVTCNDPYACSFTGDAEPRVGGDGHAWEPLAGQKLEVEARALTPHGGLYAVAQSVELSSRPAGRALQQALWVGWSASTGSLVSLTLPAGAVVSRFEMNGLPLPVLKDPQGAVQLTLPQGGSTLHAEWEVAGAAGTAGFLRPPLPTFSVPVGVLYHDLLPAPGRAVLQAGGMAGSPRVDLWPNLAAALIVALTAGWAFRAAGMPTSSVALGLAAAAGFAVSSPAAVVPLALTLGLGRWLSRNARAKGRLMVALDLLVWVGLWLTTLGLAFATLEHTLFSNAPLEVTSFVEGPHASDMGRALSWGAYLPAAEGQPLPGPWTLSVPLLWVRLLWAVWAVGLAAFLVREGRLALGYLTAYWQTATRASLNSGPAAA
jgi:hypothetical protein